MTVRTFQLLLTAFTLLLAASCARPEYWVKGLTLPPGSTVTSKSETTELGGSAAMMPMMGEVEKTLMVTFECKGGWPAVSSHFDSCMKNQGYVDTMSGLAAFDAMMPKEAQGTMDGMKYFTKSGEKYAVMVMDMGGMMSSASKGQSPPSGIPHLSGFDLTVMKFK